MLVLLFNLVFRLPYTWLAAIFFRSSRLASHRSILVILAACLMGLAYASYLERAAQVLAMPVVNAIEAYFSDKGHYPNSLDDLRPKYLGELPVLKPVLYPPEFRYYANDANLQRLVFDATGSQFAHFSYDFVAKKWSFLD